MHKYKGLSRYIFDPYSYIVFAAIILCLAGMLQVTFSFTFFSDEEHIFRDSLWAVENTIPEYYQHIVNIYDYFLTEHYEERGGHPNGVVLILGIYIWILNIFKGITPENLNFFVISIRLFLTAVALLSLFLLYLFLANAYEDSGKKVGKIAVIISALFPPFIAYSSIRAMDTLSLFFMMISLWSFVRLLKLSRPSFYYWIIPGITAGIVLALKISGPIIIMLVIVYGVILPGTIKWKELSKKIIVTLVVAIIVLVATNNPIMYINVLFYPSSTEFHSLTSSDDIRRFGFIGFQLAKLWEFIHPDYYHYMGYHRHGGPNIPQLGLVNKYLTSSFFLLYIISFIVLAIVKKWKELLILNIPFVVLFLSLPNYQTYRLLPAFPLWLATIALAIIIIWTKYQKTLYRLITSLIIVLSTLAVPVRAYFDVSVVNEDTFLDLGDIAARNRHLNFARGMFYDRELLQFRTYKLGTPFCLRPLTEGMLTEKLNFVEPGEYYVDILLASSHSDNTNGPEIRVTLGHDNAIINPEYNKMKWYRTGYFTVTPEEMDQVFLIDFKGIKYAKGIESAIGIFEIRVVKNDRVM